MRKWHPPGIRPAVIGVILIGLVGCASFATAGAIFVKSGGTMEDIWLLREFVPRSLSEEVAEEHERIRRESHPLKAPPSPERPSSPPTPAVPPAHPTPTNASERAQAPPERTDPPARR